MISVSLGQAECGISIYPQPDGITGSPASGTLCPDHTVRYPPPPVLGPGSSCLLGLGRIHHSLMPQSWPSQAEVQFFVYKMGWLYYTREFIHQQIHGFRSSWTLLNSCLKTFFRCIVDLQCCSSFRYTAKHLSNTYAYIHFFLDSFPIQDIAEY